MRGYTVLDLSLNARVVREGILYVAHTQMEEEHNTPIHILGRSAGGSAITLYLFTRSSEIFVERPSSELKPSTAIYFPIWNLTHSHTPKTGSPYIIQCCIFFLAVCVYTETQTADGGAPFLFFTLTPFLWWFVRSLAWSTTSEHFYGCFPRCYSFVRLSYMSEIYIAFAFDVNKRHRCCGGCCFGCCFVQL